jgi:hypothetical protein
MWAAASSRRRFKLIEFKDGDAQSHADRALRKLTELKKIRGEAALPAAVLSTWKNRYGTYDHLAAQGMPVGEEEEEW